MTSTATDPYAALVDAIEAGEMDSGLSLIADAVADRMKVSKAQTRAARTLADFTIGRKVRFNELTGTKYMIGETATVTARRVKKVTVRMDNPKGRFLKGYNEDGSPRSSTIICPIEILDLV